MTKDDTNRIILFLVGIVLIFTHIMIGAWCYSSGIQTGQNEIHLRDHIQAKAGFFIDGYANNKLYRVTPIE